MLILWLLKGVRIKGFFLSLSLLLLRLNGTALMNGQFKVKCLRWNLKWAENQHEITLLSQNSSNTFIWKERKRWGSSLKVLQLSVCELKEEVAMLDLVTCEQRVIWCVVESFNTGYGAPWVQEDRKWNTPLWPYPPLWARSPHGPLVYCCWQGARLIMCSLLQPRREREKESGREAEGWLPRPAGSPGPNTALMRARGADGHTQGARDYCPGPRGARERDLRRGGAETPVGTPAVILQACVKSDSRSFLLMMDVHCLEYLCESARRYMYILDFMCMSSMHNASLPKRLL